MLRCPRPPEPAEFAGRITASANEIAEVARSRPPESKDFREHWRDYKAAFSGAQHGRCGYCEGPVIGLADGDVEHYRPKAALEELPDDRARWGREVDDLSQVTGRSLESAGEGGYWWLAYSWSNYLLACECCNRKWKRGLFPVQERPRPPLEQGRVETALLLNPFEGPEPEQHLRFSDLGQVEAADGSPYGEATIHTCGLARESLRSRRAPIASKAHELMTIFQRALALASYAELRESGRDLLRLAHVENHHPGMVRAIVCDRTQLSWDEFVRLIARFEAALSARRSGHGPSR